MSKRLKVAMLVIDGNDVSGDFARRFGFPSPAMHPTIHALIDALAERDDLECRVIFGSSTPPAKRRPDSGSVKYISVPYSSFPVLGMGGNLVGRFLAIRRYVKAWKPDLVHGQGTEREAGLVAVHCGKIPSILTLHGNFREIEKVFRPRVGTYYWGASRLETHVLKRISHIVCISRYVADITQGFDASKTIIPNAVGRNFLEIARPLPSAPPRVVCLGSIDIRKRPLFILEACEILWRQGLEFTFHVYGNSGFQEEYSSNFKARLQPWIEQGRAFFEGFFKDPSAEIARARVMVSASCEESFGMNILEAMACGTPTVAPDVGGIRDIIRHDETGFLYPADETASCAAAIARLLGDEFLWERLSSEGRRRARQHFSGEKVAASTVGCYREVYSKGT